jgi:hypothetical protein
MVDKSYRKMTEGEKAIWSSCFVASFFEHKERYSHTSAVIGGAEVATKVVKALRESVETLEIMRDKEIINAVRQIIS